MQANVAARDFILNEFVVTNEVKQRCVCRSGPTLFSLCLSTMLEVGSETVQKGHT